MLPASNKGAGMNMGFPDVCATPPVGAPIPYPNMALNATAVPFALKTFFSFVNALNLGSMMPTTLGDQPGTMSPFMGPGRYTTGNPRVFVEALPGANLLCPSTGNNMIAGLCAALIPSITNVFLSYASAPRPGVLDAASLSALSAALVPSRDDEIEARMGAVTYARIPVFSLRLPARIHHVIQSALADGASALILDLRHCPGGELTSAVELAGDFLGEGSEIVTVIDGDGDDTVYRSRNEHPYSFPLVLLIDRLTASAAEVFAGSLKAHGRAVIIGERSYGKGSAQALLPGFSEPGAHYATVATMTLANGDSLDGRGVNPDLEIANPLPPPCSADFASPEATAARLAADPALAAALAAAGEARSLASLPQPEPSAPGATATT